MKTFLKWLDNNSLIMSQALTQARLKRAGVTISDDLVKEGFCFPNYPVFPKYIRDFVEDQMRLYDLQNEHKNVL